MFECYFSVNEVSYLGHIILGEGVKANLAKITSVVDWPIPTLKFLRCFLGLIFYYQKFIKHYGAIVAPLAFFFLKKRIKKEKRMPSCGLRML